MSKEHATKTMKITTRAKALLKDVSVKKETYSDTIIRVSLNSLNKSEKIALLEERIAELNEQISWNRLRDFDDDDEIWGRTDNDLDHYLEISDDEFIEFLREWYNTVSKQKIIDQYADSEENIFEIIKKYLQMIDDKYLEDNFDGIYDSIQDTYEIDEDETVEDILGRVDISLREWKDK